MANGVGLAGAGASRQGENTVPHLLRGSSKRGLSFVNLLNRVTGIPKCKPDPPADGFRPPDDQRGLLANSPLVGQIAFTNNGVQRMVTTKQFDFLNRLTNIVSSGPSTINSFNYQLNTASQRRTNNLADSSYWVYTYDSLGQVTSGKKYWSDGTPACPVRYERLPLRLRSTQSARQPVLRWSSQRPPRTIRPTSSWPGALHRSPAPV